MSKEDSKRHGTCLPTYGNNCCIFNETEGDRIAGSCFILASNCISVDLPLEMDQFRGSCNEDLGKIATRDSEEILNDDAILDDLMVSENIEIVENFDHAAMVQ